MMSVLGIGPFLSQVAVAALLAGTLGHAQVAPARLDPHTAVDPGGSAIDTVPVTLEGRVLDPDGFPAAGAQVTTSTGDATSTDADGFFRLELELPGEARGVVLFARGGPGSSQAARSTVRLAPRARQVRLDPLRLGQAAGAPRWLPTFGERPGLAGETIRYVTTAAEYDDGNGPALYVGGEFLACGSKDSRWIARWNGQRWEGVGGLNARPNVMAVFDDGDGAELFVSGFFSRAGGNDVNGVARWNGTGWAPAGTGMRFRVFSFTVFDDGGGPALYAAGGLQQAPGAAFHYFVQRWNGTEWDAVGAELDSAPQSLAVFDDGSGSALYAAGNFTAIGALPAPHIARWDGTSWSALQSGPDGAVYCLETHDDGSGPALYAGGSFTTVGSLSANRIARWDGASWTPLDVGTNGLVNCLESFDDGHGAALYAGGEFVRAGGLRVNRVARWDGTSWSALEDGVDVVDGTLPLAVWTLAGMHENGVPALFAGGTYAQAGPLDVAFLARWQDDAWTPVGPGLSHRVNDAVVFDDGTGPALHVGGVFKNAGGQRLKHVAKWNGSGWEPLGGGIRVDSLSEVYTLAVHDDGRGSALYAGGRFDLAGGVGAGNIARWDGTSWERLGTGTNGPVLDLIVFDDGSGPALYVAGDFTRAGGVNSRGVARWDGNWSDLAGGTNFRATCLGVYDSGSGPELYAGGPFTMAGGVSTAGIARWNGSSWAPLGSGVQGIVQSFGVHDDGGGPELYVGGVFSSMDGVSARNVVRWNGTRWAPLGAGANSAVRAFATHDDGSGPVLYVGGLFSTAGDLAIERIARWDGVDWSPLEGGVTSPVSRGVSGLASFDDGRGPALYAAGEFWRASESGDSNVARWGVESRSIVVLDFETEDDFATPLVNGQHIDTEFGRLVGLTSSGPNAGLGIFDSTVGGPNDPSQDRDLLVGSGNLLCLQTENFPPDADDVFPRPNDDEDGGTISFQFAQPLEPLSLALVDIDSGDGTSTLVLRDTLGKERTFTVPPSWTGDRLVAGPGRGVLDLATLDPQPGFASVATAVEDEGFDPLRVIRLSVTIAGSGAVDDLTLAGEDLPLPRASARARNGAGTNPRSLTTLTLPVIGGAWTARLDCSAEGPGLAVLEVRRAAVPGTMTPYGQVLIGGGLVHRVVRSQPGAASTLAWTLPLDMTLVGVEVHAQGFCLGGTSASGHAGQRRARLSNAVDLVLGF